MKGRVILQDRKAVLEAILEEQLLGLRRWLLISSSRSLSRVRLPFSDFRN